MNKLGIWPVHPSLMPDELLSSWLVRIAHGHGLKLHTFAHYALPGFDIWNRDIDKSAPIELISLLSKQTGKSISLVKSSTLEDYTGYLYERHISNTHLKWIMPLGIYHRARRHCGLVFCPLCLKEDSIPYFRKHWRIAFSVICYKHNIHMLDRCPQCGAVIAFHRNDFKDRNNITLATMTECYGCGFDLINSPVTYEQTEGYIKFNFLLQWILRCGYGIINKHNIYSHYYFEMLHQLLKLITLDRHGAKLRHLIESKIGLENSDITGNDYKLVERLPIEERRYSLFLLSWLLDEWPDRFISLTEEACLTKSRIEKDMNYIPFFFFRVLNNHLNLKLYSPNPPEIQAAISHILAQGKTVKITELNKLLGLSDSKSTKIILNKMKLELNI